MWKILFADDEAIYHSSVKEDILDIFFTSDIGIIDVTDHAFKDSDSANALLEKNKYHLAFIDSYYERENDIEINGKAYIASVLGEALIEKNRSQPFPFHYFFITAYQNKYLIINKAFEKYINDPKVTPFAKERMIEGDWKIDFVDKLKNILKQIARDFFKKLDHKQKRILLEKINNESLSDIDTITIDNEIWTLKAICAGWLNFENKIMDEDLKKIIRNLMIPDITLAVSEVFGVFGVKQITHDSSSYFPFKSAEDIRNELMRQFDYLDKILRESREIIGSDYLKPSDFEDDYIAFKSAALLKNLVPNNLDDDLQEMRNSKFRVGSPTMRNDRKEIIINEIHPTSFPSSLGLGKFEVNVPIDLLFTDCFKALLKIKEQNNIFYAGSYCAEDENLDHPNPQKQPNIEPCLYYNYLIIPSAILFPRITILNPVSPPTNFVCFWDKHFEYFGKYYVVSIEEDSWKSFNCTWRNAVYEAPIHQIYPSGCNELHKELLIENNDYKTFHIFIFKTWSQ